MRVAQKYSHLNGEEYLLVHKKALYKEILSAVDAVDASKFKTKISKEKGMEGRSLYNPRALNKEFGRVFEKRDWHEVRRRFHVSADPDLVKLLEPLDFDNQKSLLEEMGKVRITSFNQTDFVKQGVAVEVQLGKYFAVTYDLFVKHLSFYTGGIIDVGVEILPTKAMQEHMSSGPPFFDKEIHNILRHGRTTPPVPLVILGIEP